MLLDTSGIYCMVDRADPRSGLAPALYRQSRVRVVHSGIIVEFQPLAAKLGLARPAIYQIVRNLLEDSTIQKIWIDEPLLNRGMDLLTARPDKGYSLCDAISFIIMRDHNITEALTLDHHFDQEGFQRLLTR